MEEQQVRFILLSTYRTREELANYAANNETAVIFYKAENPEHIIETSIWARGQEYSASSSVRFRVGQSEPESGFSDAVLGDFYVKEEVLTGDKKSRTAYIYALNANSQPVWQALDGNVSIENVYLKDNITLAGSYTRVGNVTKSSTTSTGTLDSAGKNLKQVLESIFTEEIYPTTSKTSTASLTASVSAPSPTLKNGSTTYSDSDLVEVGTSGITLQKLTANATLAEGYTETTVSGFTYGYADDVNGTNKSSNTSISVSRSVEDGSGDYKLDVTFEGFSSQSSISKSDASVSNVVINATTLGNISFGTNKVTVKETGKKKKGSVPEIPSKYIASNLEKFSENHKSTKVPAATLSETSAPTNSKSITLYGVYPIYTNGTAATEGDTNDSPTAAYSPSIIKLDINSTYSSGSGNPKKFYVGFGTQSAGNWELYVSNKYNTLTAKAYNPSTTKFDAGLSFAKSSATESGIPANYNKFSCSGSAGKNIVEFSIS